MKKQSERKDELRTEYDMKSLLKGGVRGKYAARYRDGTNLVLLEPEVAKAFPNDKAVNDALKLVMKLKQVQEMPVSIQRNDELPYSKELRAFKSAGFFY